MGRFIYNLFILLYSLGIRLAAAWNKKAQRWINGRKHVFEDLKQMEGKPGPLVWMHCASLGEFEQGRPLLESLKKQYPGTRILLSFFSPSGYEIRKNYALADKVIYLPMDGKANAEKLISMTKPDLVLWVKYEYWYYYLTELKKRNIPVLLVSGIFRESQPFFKWYGDIWRKMLGAFDQLFVQTPESVELLKAHQLASHITLSGDTRFDRVIDIAENPEPLPQPITDFCSGHPVLVAGSTWIEDEAELVHFARANPVIRFIIAPHEIHREHVKEVLHLFGKNTILYSALAEGKAMENENVLIIDNIGMLSKLYRYATVTYIGGGFGDAGIHNVLEAAVYGKPVIFGPAYEKFAEAVGLVACGGAFPVNNAIELEKILNSLFNNQGKLAESSEAAQSFVYANRGATRKILDYIQEKRLLIN